MGAAPLVARVAGLPAEAVLRFSTRLGEGVAELDRAQASLGAAREALAERIHALVPAAGPAERRFLLAVRRDCHNGRTLARHRAAPGWSALRAASGALADRAAEAEDRFRALDGAFRAAYDAERVRQDAALRAPLAEPGFRRALALASPDLAASGIRTPKAEANLLRYASRAAMKLSPFSAFTRVSLAAAEEGPEGPATLAEGPWVERSLVRIKPYLLEKCASLLFRHPPIRRGLRVAVNSSVVETESGRVLFLRPARWEMEEGAFTYHAESLVRVGLAGPLVRALRERMPRPAPTLGELVPWLAEALDAPAAAVEAEVEALLGIGFLVPLTPWATQEGHTEAGMLRWIAALPESCGAGAVRDRLAGLVAAEAAFAELADPLAGVAALDAAIDRLWEASAELGGVDPEAGYARAGRHSVYEDVFAAPAAPGGAWPAALRVPRRAAERALASVQPMVRLASLFDHRHDWLHALEAFARTRWGAEADVPALEVFGAVQPLWRSHIRFRMEARAADGWRSTWNPLALAEVDALAGLRAMLAGAAGDAAVRERGEQRIDGDALARRLDAVPERYRPQTGGCLFLQPADGEGRRWVLNRLKEGTGRFGSRFTPVMDDATRARYTAHLVARGRIEIDGEHAALLDLRCVQGDTLNVHALQTPRVLALPGAEGEAPAAARIPLDELRVRFGAGTPHLRDARGARLAPVQLGFAFEDYLPPLVKFLACFGPSELSAVFPAQWAEETDGTIRLHRTRIGSVLLHRAGWAVPAAPLRDALAGRPDADAFAAVQRWRARHGIPERCFVMERATHPRQGERVQPQYLDLGSPLFAGLLRTAAAAAGEHLTFFEALPDPLELPADDAGRRWAVELLVDSLALAPSAPAVRAKGARRPRTAAA